MVTEWLIKRRIDLACEFSSEHGILIGPIKGRESDYNPRKYHLAEVAVSFLRDSDFDVKEAAKKVLNYTVKDMNEIHKEITEEYLSLKTELLS